MSKIEVDVLVLHKTASAVLVTDDEDSGAETWLPLESVTTVPEDFGPGDVIKLTADERILTERGLL